MCKSFCGFMTLFCLFISFASVTGAGEAPSNSRRPGNDAELEYWLQNMIWHHRFSTEEIRAATGLSAKEIRAAREKFDIHTRNRPSRKPGAPLLVLPHPGGRHPRIGFLEGAIDPQRETKIDVFAPWSDADYVTVDVPEAIWSNLGLTYLAHTHVPTVWTKRNIDLERLEWNRRGDGTFDVERRLPNGIIFGARVVPTRKAVLMDLWLTNGTTRTLTNLRVQNCVMLKNMKGFNGQTNENKVRQPPYIACRSDGGDRWVVTAWKPLHRLWANDKCPCMHSDPVFPDCPPGETKRLKGWLSFHKGKDIEKEIERIDKTKWFLEK